MKITVSTIQRLCGSGRDLYKKAVQKMVQLSSAAAGLDKNRSGWTVAGLELFTAADQLMSPAAAPAITISTQRPAAAAAPGSAV